MTADAPATAAGPVMTNQNSTSPQHPLFLFLLGYRWASLLLAMWLFLVTSNAVAPGISLSLLITVALGATLLITVLHTPLTSLLLNTPLLLSIDLGVMALLLTFSGITRSPYNLYALSPLLAGAFFFQMRGAIYAVAGFTALYPITVLALQFWFPLEIDPGQLFNQLVGAWLVTILFGSLSSVLEKFRQAHTSLIIAHEDLARQNAELAATHHQLEMIHELSLFLHASDSQSVQQRLLKAVTRELDFPRAVVGLVNPILHRLEGWQSFPALSQLSPAVAPVPLTDESSPLVRAVLQQQVQWYPSEQEPLSANEALNAWLGPGRWLILPMIWQEQPVGLLLVIVEKASPVEQADDRWAILSSLVSQAAAALGTIDRTSRLAIEQERNRIARDIHDTVAQSLFGMVFTLDACAKLLPGQAAAVKQELLDLRDIADRVRQDVRQSILDLWPSNLTQEQFQIDLSKYVANCVPARHFEVDFTFDGDFDGLSPVIRRSLYRVCQEALANAAQHSGCDSARVYLAVEPEEVYMSIRDKGRGFEPKVALMRERNREQFGLRGMQERIEALKGTCNILSQTGQGTQILVRVPLNGKNSHG